MDKSKYDELSRSLCEALEADAVLVVVIGGTTGTGACPALRAGPQARPAAKALRIALLQMAELVILEGERAADAGAPAS
jgi:hypothetical protein